MQNYKKIWPNSFEVKSLTKLLHHCLLKHNRLRSFFFYLLFLTPSIPANSPLIQDFARKIGKIHCSNSPTIPKLFHFIWIGPRPFPIASLKNLISFKKHHQDARFIFWSDKPIEPLLDFLEPKIIDPKQFTLQQFYEKSENVGQKSDIARFEILYLHGGIYADHDALCTKSLEPLLNSFDFVAGAEHKAKKLGIGLLLSKPKHPIYLHLLKRLKHLFEHDQSLIAKKNDKRAVLHSTYNMFSTIVFAHLNQNDLIAPSFYFYPKHQKPLFSKHDYASSWIQDYSLVKLNQTNQIIKHNYFLLKLCFFLLLPCSFLLIKRWWA